MDVKAPPTVAFWAHRSTNGSGYEEVFWRIRQGDRPLVPLECSMGLFAGGLELYTSRPLPVSARQTLGKGE